MNHVIVTCIAVACAVIAAAVWIRRALQRELQRRLDDVTRHPYP